MVKIGEFVIEVELKEAKKRLSQYIRLVHDGEQIVITKRGTPVAEIRAVNAEKDPVKKLKKLHEVARKVATKATGEGPCAARSADFLYSDDGMPTDGVQKVEN